MTQSKESPTPTDFRISRACRDNPDLPKEFVKELLEVKDEMESNKSCIDLLRECLADLSVLKRHLMSINLQYDRLDNLISRLDQAIGENKG